MKKLQVRAGRDCEGARGGGMCVAGRRRACDMMCHLNPPDPPPPYTRLPCLWLGMQDHHDQSQRHQRPGGDEMVGAEKQQVRGVGLQTPTCRRTFKR